MDTGGLNRGLDTTVETALAAGCTLHNDHPVQRPGGPAYPILTDRMSLGRAIRADVPGLAGSLPFPAMFGFDVLANFTHEYFTPFAITFDFTTMDFAIG